MASKSIYFYLEADERNELETTAANYGIKPSELARRRYRQGLRTKAENGPSPDMEALLKMSSFQYAALESIAKAKEDKYDEILERGSKLYNDAISRSDRT